MSNMEIVRDLADRFENADSFSTEVVVGMILVAVNRLGDFKVTQQWVEETLYEIGFRRYC